MRNDLSNKAGLAYFGVGLRSMMVFVLTFSSAIQAQALSDGKVLFESRIRLESVEEETFTRDASALTLRSRLGWKSPSSNGFHAVIEVEDVRALDSSYNSTANGRSSFPVVVDPEGSEWNQVFLAWSSNQVNPAEGTFIQLGRQRLAYDNQRFIGNVGWRQNEQTFDALSIRRQIHPALLIQYAWLDKAHRIFGNEHPNPLLAEHDLDSHLLNASWNSSYGSFTGYAYLIENQDFIAQSTRTMGLRHQRTAPISKDWEWWHTAEFASQESWRSAPNTGSVNYLNVEAGIRRSGHSLRLGFERLDSNGRRAFQTPLATGHAFNGWADRFLTTPTNGLDDLHLKLDGPLGPTRFLVALHRFGAALGSNAYGREFNAQIAWPFAKGWNALAKFADYRSDGFANDGRKFWVSVEFKY